MKNVVLCGSMKVVDKIIEVGNALEKKGFNILLPKECMDGLPKKIASRAHFDRIVDKNNEIVLIVNATKNGLDNYVGPNSLCEIACAFYNNKRTYLLNDIYEPFKDEIDGWGVIPLKGDLNKLK